MKNEEQEKSCVIVSGALELFMKFGVKSMTMQDVSSKLGMSKKTLYQFVKDKKDLVKKGMCLCIEEEQSFLSKVTKESENAIDELIGFTLFVNSRLRDMHVSVIYDIKKYHPESWKMMDDHKQMFVKKAILENTKRGIKEGIYRKNLNPEIITSLYMVMVESFFQVNDHFGKDVKLEELHLEMIRYHVRGVANDKGIALLKETLKKEENNHLKLH